MGSHAHPHLSLCPDSHDASVALIPAPQAAQPIDNLYSAAPPIWNSATFHAWGAATAFGNATQFATPGAVSLAAGGLNINPANGQPLAAGTNKAWRSTDTFIAYPTGFSSGVASGDPLPGQIIIWTRFQPAGDASSKAAADPTNTAYVFNATNPAGYLPMNITWWLGPNANGGSPTATGVFPTDGSRDWTVKVDVNYAAASASAGQAMYYQFSNAYGGNTYTSALGSFRAINAANTLSQLNYAVVSCSNYGFGLFNAYDMLAKVDNLDFWSHVGDTIYEYADLVFPNEGAKLRSTVADPPNEIVSLDDYRRRHRESRSGTLLSTLLSRRPASLSPSRADILPPCALSPGQTAPCSCCPPRPLSLSWLTTTST